MKEIKEMLSTRSRVVSAGLVVAVSFWSFSCGSGAAQQTTPQAASDVLDLEKVIGESTERTRFHAIRVNDIGAFVWVERGDSPRSGSRAVTVYQVSEQGILLRETDLPNGARLTGTGEFGVDAAGNIYFLWTGRDDADESEAVVSVAVVDSRGEMIEEHLLPGLPATFSVGSEGSVWLLTDDAEVSRPNTPRTAIARGQAPERVAGDGPAKWVPYLERTPDGDLVLLDGVGGTFEVLNGLSSSGRRPIPSNEVQIAVRHIEQDHADPVGAAGGISLRPALRGASVDEQGIVASTLMGTRPSQGIIVIRFTVDGRGLAPLRLAAPVDTKLVAAGAAEANQERALMFPQDLAIWRGTVFVLGVNGLLATYPLADARPGA